MEILKSIELSHSFDYPLFRNIDFSIDESQSVALTGISGCGKSTFLNILCTLLIPNSGEVIYKNQSIYTLSLDELLKIRRYDFGIIFQSHYLFKGFSAIENIEISTKLTNKKIDNTIMQKMKIDNILTQKIGELSGGQQQRVSIARVLSKKPKIIFADEPTGNLDKDTANDVMNVLFEYIEKNSAALVLVTHDENLAKKCTKTYRLENKALNLI